MPHDPVLTDGTAPLETAARLRILYVEDDTRDADLTRRALLAGLPRHELVIVPTVAEARQRLTPPAGENAALPFDLVLTDMRLPDASGLDLLAFIRGEGWPLPVVVITGNGDDQTVVVALKSGADDYLVKRDDYLTRLPATLEGALRRFRRGRASLARPLRILYAEHHAADIDLTRRHLARHAPHLRLDAVPDDRELLQCLPRRGPLCAYDVLLLDYRLAGSNALEVLKELREKRGIDIPTVIVSGQGDEEVALQAIKLGAADYLVKGPDYLYRLPVVLENAFIRAELTREQAALRASEARSRAIVEAEPECVKLLSEDGRILEMNPAGLRMLGADSFEQVAGYDCLALVAPEHRAAFAALNRRVFSGESGRLEFELIGLHGVRLWVDMHTVPLRDAAGTITASLSITRDITERRQAEAALRESEAQLARAQEIARLASGTWDLLTGTVTATPLLIEIYGLEPASSVQADQLMKAVHPDDAEPTRRAMQEAIESDAATYLSDFRIVRPLGGVRRLSLRSNIIRDAAGRAVKMEGTVQDVTEQWQLAEQLRQAQKMEAIGQLAAGVAHDFNNMLTVIGGNTSLLLADVGADSEPGLLLREIASAASRAGDLTRQLLLFSRKQELQTRPVRLDELLGNLTRMLSRLLGEDILLDFHCAALEPVVEVDAGMIEQIVVNLAVNARDAMPDGGTLRLEIAPVEIAARQTAGHPEARPGSFFCLSIADSGAGIPAALLPRICEPFFTTKDVGKGTGLGLATVDAIARQHHGWMEISSLEGAGTTFRIMLPAARGEIEAAPARPPLDPVRRGSETILVVEDEASLRDLVKTVLQRQGYQVVTARSGLDALNVWAEHGSRVDLLLTDMVMPDGVNGRELAAKLQASRPELRVIYTSGYSSEAALRGLQLEPGANFLQKPFMPTDLLAIVRARLEARG